jgi:hypothetical protein
VRVVRAEDVERERGKARAGEEYVLDCPIYVPSPSFAAMSLFLSFCKHGVKLRKTWHYTAQYLDLTMNPRALRANFQALSDSSLKTSRQLDDTYYSILEKLSTVRQTIGNLQELSTLTKQLHATFLSDTTELTEDIEGQFEVFRDFDGQEKLLDDLEGRIKVGKEKADALTKRLDDARRRVEAREKVEKEWETKTNRTCTDPKELPKLS